MKNCRTCGNDIDKELDKCPYCNTKQPPTIIVKNVGPGRVLFSGILIAGIPLLALYLLPMLFLHIDTMLENKIQDNQEEVISPKDKEILDSLDYVNKIDYDIFISLINSYNFEDQYIMIGNYIDPTTIEFLKKVNRTIIDYEYQVFYLDISQLNEQEIANIKNQYPKYKDFDQVPCLYYTKLDNDPIRINGDITFDEYKEFIENNGVRRKVKR